MFAQLTSSFRKLGIKSRDVAFGKPLVTVFGATGAQGSSVAVTLVNSGKYKVQGVTRNPESERAKKLKQGGVEVVKADLANKEELLQALKGAYAAFVVTDFWTVREQEFEMGKLAVECAKEAGVKHLIWSTLPNTEKISGGEISVPHFVSKAKVDAVVEDLGFEHHTFLMCAFYYQNFAQFGFTVAPDKAKEAEGERAGAKEGASWVASEASSKSMQGVKKAEGEETAGPIAEAAGIGAGAGESSGVEGGGGKAEGDTGKAGTEGPGVAEEQSVEAGPQPEPTSPVAHPGTESSEALSPVVFRLPLGADDMLTAFDVDDTGNAVLSILDNPKEWDGKRVCLAGFHAPAAEYARVFEEVTKRPSSYEAVPADTEEFKEMFKWFATHTVFGPYDITNGRKCYPGLKSWEEWLHATPWAGP